MGAARAGRRGRVDGGAAVADFAMVAGLVTLLFLGACQLGFTLHVRNTLTAHAIEGARHGARADVTVEDGARRARQMINTSLSDRFARDIGAQRRVVDGVVVVQVDVHAPLPLLGPWGPGDGLHVRGRAYAEDQG